MNIFLETVYFHFLQKPVDHYKSSSSCSHRTSSRIALSSSLSQLATSRIAACCRTIASWAANCPALNSSSHCPPAFPPPPLRATLAGSQRGRFQGGAVGGGGRLGGG